MRQTNRAGLELVISFESYSAIAYQDEGGVWTIGFGHTAGVNESISAISHAEAIALLRNDFAISEKCVEALVKVDLNNNQFAALVSLTYNTGPEPLRRGLGIKLNESDYQGAADQFLRWRTVDGLVSDGLVRRRTAERALFLTPDASEV